PARRSSPRCRNLSAAGETEPAVLPVSESNGKPRRPRLEIRPRRQPPAAHPPSSPVPSPLFQSPDGDPPPDFELTGGWKEPPTPVGVVSSSPPKGCSMGDGRQPPP